MDSYRGVGLYKKYGYIPYNSAIKGEENWSMSKSLEYAYDDYCIARMAERWEDRYCQTFYDRSQNYRKLFNPETGFMQPKMIKEIHPRFQSGRLYGIYLRKQCLALPLVCTAGPERPDGIAGWTRQV